MDRLFDTIKQLVLDDRYIIGDHAVDRLDQRRVLEWQNRRWHQRGDSAQRAAANSTEPVD
ncbi:MAG: hypothetical protein ACR2GY_13165 [Phycisphaerales bacterium]